MGEARLIPGFYVLNYYYRQSLKFNQPEFSSILLVGGNFF